MVDVVYIFRFHFDVLTLYHMTSVRRGTIDIRTVDPMTLVEASSISVDMDLPKDQRMRDTVNQMGGNPYFFRSGALAVKVSYTDSTISFDERMESYLRTL